MRAADTRALELYGFFELADFLLCLSLCPRARLSSLSTKAVPRASSCARSEIEAGAKLPTPDFEELGSGL